MSSAVITAVSGEKQAKLCLFTFLLKYQIQIFVEALQTCHIYVGAVAEDIRYENPEKRHI